MSALLIRGGRLVGSGRPADVRVGDGRIVEVGPDLDASDATVLDAGEGWLIPGLWDAHVHFGQWVRSRAWLDVSSADDADGVRRLIAAAPPSPGRPLIGFGHRSAGWPRQGTVADLDAVSGDRPVFLISGDAHNGWLNSAALRLAGLAPRGGPLQEAEWFPVLAGLGALPGVAPSLAEEAAGARLLASRGLVGIVDLEFSDAHVDWPRRIAGGLDLLRVRAGFYEHQLDEVISSGLRTGAPLEGTGLATMGPLKVISDGSLSTRTAWCCEPYVDSESSGAPNLSSKHLRNLLSRAAGAGLEVAVHAIGDRANTVALDAFEATGAHGSIEHAQLLRVEDVARFAALGVTASIQPAHLLDDRDLTEAIWGERGGRSFLARSLLDAGTRLALGSDAPVSPPDPWLAMAAAVHRSGDARPGWHQDQALTAAEALAGSTDGGRLAPGARGDVVVLESDPLAAGPADEVASRLRSMRVRATVCAGRVTWVG
ncbi:hypothetical protein BW730_17645 [Tessaracoccus aquimaris]|uniref:Amidohydrolase 3 domain-containing protein n=1 Tax=Tessaracoccus aquimaris TaxID=1332264 RepID=A0A1Q2CSD5_9ACTN|nr:amidohydrolase [Tessaracoccus aquimaris]AQP49048.1 hypothetical protein BW730_17645 [Tessaracoccus aquimaris]